jgi:hypothetical protein
MGACWGSLLSLQPTDIPRTGLIKVSFECCFVGWGEHSEPQRKFEEIPNVGVYCVYLKPIKTYTSHQPMLCRMAHYCLRHESDCHNNQNLIRRRGQQTLRRRLNQDGQNF